jgi:hypothetical protein
MKSPLKITKGNLLFVVVLILGALIISSNPNTFAIPFFWILIFAVREIWITFFRRRNKSLAAVYAVITISLSAFIFSGWIENPAQNTSIAGVEDYAGIQGDLEADLIEEKIIESEFKDGILSACNDLFAISPDEILYENNNELYLEDCENWGGTYEGEYETPYDEGYFKTIEEMFLETPYWCWGVECVTEADF